MKKVLVVLVFVMLATALLHASSFAQTESGKIRLVTRETSLGKVHPGIDWYNLVVSSDNKRFAYVAKRGDKELVVVDGVEGKEYDMKEEEDVLFGFCNPMFSPDSKRFAYVAGRGGKELVVVDGEEGKEYDEIRKSEYGYEVYTYYSLTFSPDSKRVAYRARRGGKWLVVVDGEEGKEYDEIGLAPPIFSPDSKRVAYAASRGYKWLVVVDGVEGKEYDGIWEYLYEEIVKSSLIFSPDSKRVAYAASRGYKWLVVVDGEEGKEYDGIWEEHHVGLAVSIFSPDSKRMAYRVMRGGKWLVVVDGVEGNEYDGIGNLLFSPDSKRVAYTGNQLVVVDEVEGKEYDYCEELIFSPDSKRVAYVARRGNKDLVVVDGVEGKEYDGIMYLLTFSPDSKRVAYTAGNQLVVVDEVEGKEYDYCEELIFSPDSKRVAYVAKRGNKELVVVDGVEGKEYDFLGSKLLVFDSPNLLRTLARQGDEIFRVEIEIEELALIKRYNALVDGESSLLASEDMDYRVLIAVEKKNQYPTFSPDGLRIAFEAGAGNMRHIWVVNSDGSHPRQLTPGKWGAYKPVWSPDGKKIAFFSDQSGNFDIWLMNADGSGMQQLTKDPKPDRYPTFSPDGKRIAFSSWRHGGPHLYVMDVDGSDLRQITFGEGGDYEPSWAPHRDEIAFFSKRSGKYAIWKVNADGTELRQLTPDYEDMYMSAWWPDGSQILAFNNSHSIFLANRDGSEVTGILTLESNLWHPVVSNDGTKILFETAASFLPDEKTPDEIVILEAKMPATEKRKAYQQQFDYLIPEGYEIINTLQEDTNHDSIPELLLGIQGEPDEEGFVNKPALLLIFERRENRWVEVWSFYFGEYNYFGYWGDIGLMDGIWEKSLRVMDINGDGKKDLFFVTTAYAWGSGYTSHLHLYSWDDKASTYVPLTTEEIAFGEWGARLLADGLVIRDIEPRYNGKEIIVAKYIFDYDAGDAGDLAGWEIFFYGWEAGSYILYKQIKTPKKYENATFALRSAL